MRTGRTFARAAALAIALAALPRSAAASEADAFENKIPPIAGQLYTKAARFELSPIANLSLNDAFYSKLLVGARLGYHLSEAWSLAGSYTTGPSWYSGAAQVCSTNTPCRTPTSDELHQLPGKIKAVGGAEVAFSPIYGKLNLFAEKVVHFDLSLMGGGDWISYQEPSDQSTMGGHLGVGVRIFLAEFMAVRLSLKDYMYSVPIQGLQNQLFTEMGLSFFFPFHSATP